MNLGDKAADFSLKGTDGKTHTLAEFSGAKALVVVFSCNHCPYVQAYEGRMVEVQRDYKDKGVLLVAINSNDAKGYPDDSFENMVSRAKEQGFNFPYLRDEDQSVAKAYGAVRTPHVFLFDAARKLAYLGRIDDSWDKPEKVQHRELAEAIEDLLAGKPVRTPETFAIGCTIKWKD